MNNKKNIFNAIIGSIKLNLNNVFYLFCSEELNFLSLSQQNQIKKFRNPLFKGILLFFGGFYNSIRNYKFNSKRLVSKKFIFYCGTINHKSVLNPISKNTPLSTIIEFNSDNNYNLNKLPAFLISLFFFPIFFSRYFFSKKEIKNVYRYRLSYIWLSFGYYIYFFNILKSLNNHIVILPNDHEYKAKIIREIAFQFKIPTVYIQHASISPYFPPLDFEYAFLDGLDSIEKYSSIGSSQTIVFLTGNPKYDDWFSYQNKSKKVMTVGICTNIIDSLDKVFDFSNFLITKYPHLKISLRPHPGDTRYYDWLKISKTLGIELNDSRKCSIFNYLNMHDSIVACESNIHLEAAILNVVPIYFNFQETIIYSDVYGFSKKGLVFDCKNSFSKIEDLFNEILLLKPCVFNRTKSYLGTSNTRYEGKSAILISKLLTEIHNKNIDYSIWEKCTNVTNINVYKLI